MANNFPGQMRNRNLQSQAQGISNRLNKKECILKDLAMKFQNTKERKWKTWKTLSANLINWHLSNTPPQKAAYKCFSSACGRFIEVDFTLGYKIHLNRYKKLEIIQSMSSHHKRIKLSTCRKKQKTNLILTSFTNLRNGHESKCKSWNCTTFRKNKG